MKGNEMALDARTLKAYQVFRANGGTPAGSLRCARAEENARVTGAYVEWTDDWSVGSHIDEYEYEREPRLCESATLRAADGRVLGSLSCVDDADGYYRRLVEAQLFIECLPDPGDTYAI